MLKIKEKQQHMQEMPGAAQSEPPRPGAPGSSLPYSPGCRSPHQSPQQRHVHPGRRLPAPNAPPLLPTIRPCHNPVLQQSGLMHTVPDVSFSHTKRLSRVFLERGVRQSILGPPPLGTPMRDLCMNFAGHYPSGSRISREDSVQNLDSKKGNVPNIRVAGKSNGQMRKTNADSAMGKVVHKGTTGQIHSSFPEQAEPPSKKHRGQRPNEMGEDPANGNKMQPTTKANPANISEEDSGTAQREEDQNRAAEVKYPSISNILPSLPLDIPVQGVGTSLKVTIQRSSESRAFSTSPEEMAAGASHDGEKEREHTVKFTCHICNITCPDQQGFQAHMISADHQQHMMEIQHVSNSCLSTLLPQTQGFLHDTNRKRRIGQQRWCPICQCHFSGDLIEHRQTKKHKNAKVSSRPFCTLCERHFRTPRKFVEHMKSAEHKQRVEELRHEGDPEVMEELITVDAIGCFEGEDDYEEERNEEEVTVFEKHLPQSEMTLEEKADYEAYDPDTQYGTGFVVPVAGFLCKLCHKFYHFESSARETHCRSLMHFQNLQKHNALKMQKKAVQDDCESDVSCNSPMRDFRGLELITSCTNKAVISDSGRTDFNRVHVKSSRERLHSSKFKPSKRPHKFRSTRSKHSVASHNPAVVMKRLIQTPHSGSRSSQESYYQESNRPDSSVQLQCTESMGKDKAFSDPVNRPEEQENVCSTPTHSLCHVSPLNSENNVTQSMEVKETVSKDQTRSTLHVHKSSASFSVKTIEQT